MQQMIPDIDPWKFKAFHPEDCPTEVLDKLPFGECIQAYYVNDVYSTCRCTVSSILDYSTAKDVMDHAYADGKEKLYPELALNKAPILQSEIIKNDSDNRFKAVMSTVSIPTGLISLKDSEESIHYWQDIYTPMYHDRVMQWCGNNRVYPSKEPGFDSLIIPKVYYDIDANIIYNRVMPLKAGDYCIIPLYVSSFGGAILVKAIDDCLVPLGTGRCRTSEEAYTFANENRESKALREYHTYAIQNAYNDYTYAEFNDKSILTGKLASLPVKIVKEMYTCRL